MDLNEEFINDTGGNLNELVLSYQLVGQDGEVFHC